MLYVVFVAKCTNSYCEMLFFCCLQVSHRAESKMNFVRQYSERAVKQPSPETG